MAVTPTRIKNSVVWKTNLFIDCSKDFASGPMPIAVNTVDSLVMGFKKSVYILAYM